MKCAYCKYNDGVVYTSNPPKYRCSVTGEYHLALDDCNVEFAPVKHGQWEQYLDEGLKWKCSKCGSRFATPWRYCPNCGAKMFGKDIDVSDKSVGKMDEVEE